MPESRKPPVRRSSRTPRPLTDEQLRDARPARGADPTGTLPNDYETDDVDRLLNELGDDVATVILHRRNGPAWEYLDHMGPGEFTMEAVKFAWGGGHYRARILDADRELVRSATFMIAGKAKTPPEENPPSAHAAPVNDALARMERMMERFIDMQSRGSAPRTDPVMGTILTALVQSMNREPKRDPLLDTLITSMLNREGTDIAKLLEMIERARDTGLELGSKMVGGGHDDAGVSSLVKEVGVPLIELARSAMGNRPSNGTPRPAVQAALAASNPPAQPVVSTHKTPPAVDVSIPAHVAAWLPQVRPFVPWVLKWARAGKDPGIKAAFVIDELTDEQAELLAAVALTDTFASDVLTYIPEFLGGTPDVREWVQEFLDAIVDILQEPGDETGELETVPGVPEAERVEREKTLLDNAGLLGKSGKGE